MTGLHDIDIKLGDNWQLTQAADGDAPLCSELDCLYQNIGLEALTQLGDLFYDAEWGCGLYGFIQSEFDELTQLEITQRIKSKLERREVILPESIAVMLELQNNNLIIRTLFQLAEENEPRQLNIIVDSVSVEVVSND